MSSELQLDVCCRSCCGGDIWWTHTKERQAWCYLQVKLCDPRLSALSVVATIKALYKYTSFLSFPFLSFPMSLCRSLCEKWGLFFIMHGVKVNGQYCWDILLSQQMLDAMNMSFVTFFSFSVKQSNCCSAKLSASFLLMYGSVTVQSLTPLTTTFRKS